EPRQEEPVLAAQQREGRAVRLPEGQQQLEVDGLAELLGLGVRLPEPLEERVAPGRRGAIGQLVAVAAAAARLDEPVPLQALERGVDLANVHLPCPAEQPLDAALDLVPV